MGMLLTASRSFAVTPTGAAVARTRLPMPIREFRRAEILHAYQERSSLRGLTRTFGVSRTTVSSWIKKKELSFLPYVPPCSPRTQRIPLPRLLDVDCPVPQDASSGGVCRWGSEQKDVSTVVGGHPRQLSYWSLLHGFLGSVSGGHPGEAAHSRGQRDGRNRSRGALE